MSHGPQHFESNNWQGKGCRSVCRITINIAWSRGPNRTRFLAVQAAIRAKMQCDKKSLLVAADASKKRNLMAVGGHADNAVDLCGEDSSCFIHDYHLTLVEYIKPQNTHNVCTTREKETDRDTLKKNCPTKK